MDATTFLDATLPATALALTKREYRILSFSPRSDELTDIPRLTARPGELQALADAELITEPVYRGWGPTYRLTARGEAALESRAAALFG